MLSAFSLTAQERILSFDSDITLTAHGAMHVVETITVNAEHRQIRRGIYRTFPTTYEWGFGFATRVPFRVMSVVRDGKPDQFNVVRQANGYRIDIGPDHEFIPRGEHTYTITYETDRQMGFFKTHDELYWNVNGTGWDFTIDHLRATVHFPQSIDREKLEIEAYTGRYGQKDAYYDAKIAADNRSVTFTATKPLYSGGNLSIVVAFPKGIFVAPTWYQQWWYFLRDNYQFFLALLLLLIMITWYYATYRYYYRRQKKGTIVPLFYPPDGMTPGQMGYMHNKGESYSQFTADMVDEAVRGFITIEQQDNWLRKRFTIKKTDKEVSHDSRHGFADFLSKRRSITLGTYDRDFEKYLERYNKQLKEQNEPYFISRFFIFPRIILFIGVGIIFLYDTAILSTGVFIVGFFILIVHLIFYNMLRLYTPEGRKIQDKIDGFYMFLSATEKDRIERVGTPPVKTPELYEKYLPYAIALGVESRWARQFEEVFAQMAAAGHSYYPVWYLGHGNRFSARSFASDFSTSLNSSIASSAQAPGSSSGLSGRGGGGFSGGGGGGGGGGGR